MRDTPFVSFDPGAQMKQRMETKSVRVDPSRRTGRTTRMLLRALVPLSEHRIVFILAHTGAYAQQLERELIRFAYAARLQIDTSRLRSMSVESWYATHQTGYNADELRVFVDHFAGGDDEAVRAFQFATGITPKQAAAPPPPIRDARFYFWKFVHNALIHPLLSLPWEPKFLQRWHDATAKRCKGAG